MINLEELWKKRAEDKSPCMCPMPGSIENLVEFLGAKSKEELETMNFAQLEKLPGVVNRNLSSLGGFPYLRGTYAWKWYATENGPNQRKGEQFSSCEQKSYDTAALMALVNYWELLTFRKKQFPNNQ